MVTHAVIPCKAWDHILTATFLILCSVFLLNHRPWGEGAACGMVCWLCLPTVSLWLHLHRESRSTGSSGWGQVGAKRFKSLDCLLSEASGNATQGKPAGMMKRLTVSGVKSTVVDVFLKFCAQEERGRTEDISISQNEKNSCSSGCKAASSGRHRHFRSAAQHPASSTAQSSSRSEMGQTARVMCSSPPCAGLLFAMAAGATARAHSNTQGNSCLIGERKSILKPAPVLAHHSDKQ